MGASTLLLLLSGPQPGRVTSLPPSSLQPCGRIGELWVLFCLLAAAQQLPHCVAGSIWLGSQWILSTGWTLYNTGRWGSPVGCPGGRWS